MRRVVTSVVGAAMLLGKPIDAQTIYPPTYDVPGTSVFNAFYNLMQLVSSTYPFTKSEHGGPARRISDADQRDLASKARSSSFHDATQSLYARGRAAARMASEMLGSGELMDGFGRASSSGAWEDDGLYTGRRLVGGAPVRSASSPAALFCDVEGTNITEERILAGEALRDFNVHGLRRRRLHEGGPGVSHAPLHASAADFAAGDSAHMSGNGGRGLWDVVDGNSPAFPGFGFGDAPPFTYPIAWPFARFAVEEWCTLARFQPHVLASFGIGDPKTLLVPDFFAFLAFSERFPAWYEWMASLPPCVSSFNRMAFFLQLHATWRRVDCSSPPHSNCSYVDFPSAALPRVGSSYYYAGKDIDHRPFLTSEKLRVGRILGPHVTNWTTCLVDTRRHFEFDSCVSPNVRSQFRGRDGNILILDKVMVPLNEKLMRYPSVTALDYVLSHPHMRNFSRLLVTSGLAPFLALAPLFSDHLLAFLGPNSTHLACVCRDALGTDVPPDVCRAVLRFLYNMFHSITLFAPVDAAFARLPSGVADFLFDPLNVELARYVVLTHILHGQTYLYDCSLGDVIRNWKRLDQRTASNAILTLSSVYDSVTPQTGNWHGRRAQAGDASMGGSSSTAGTGSNSDWRKGDPDAATGPYQGQSAGSNTAAASAADPSVTGSSFTDSEPECDNGANIVTGGRSIVLLLHFNNPFNPSPWSARTLTTNIETTTGIVHKIDGLLLDGCASGAATSGLYGDLGAGRFSILDCQCANGNPFPLACSPSATSCPLDGNNTHSHWPWRLDVAGGGAAGEFAKGCRCPVRPWDAVFVDGVGDISVDPTRRRYVPWHSLNAELLQEALAIDTQWQVTQLLQEFGGFRRLLMNAAGGSDALARVAAAEAEWGVLVEP